MTCLAPLYKFFLQNIKDNDMYFIGYFNHAYTVKELSVKQAKWQLTQQLTEKNESFDNVEQLLNRSHSYRSNLNMNKRFGNF